MAGKNAFNQYKDLFPSFFGKTANDFMRSVRFPQANYYMGKTLFTHSFNGEKNFGEIGPPKVFSIDYDSLRARSWQSFLESEVTQTVLSRYDTWVIGSGLKLQSEPNKKVLELEKVKLDVQEFSETVEAYFSLFRESKAVDYSERRPFDELASIAHKNSLVGGDVLVILRYENDNMSVQLIDGAHVQSPMYGSDAYPTMLASGLRLMNGIEVDEKDRHIAYYVRNIKGMYDRIPAKGSTGLQMAYLVYGLEYRLNNVRGLPLISAVLETLKKLERYKEATVGSAEERQKIALAVEHAVESTGENPFEKQLTRAWNVNESNEDIVRDDIGKNLTNDIIATTNKQVINLPQGAKLTSLETKNELYFKDFYGVNIDLVCAALSIPPNVAMSKYDASFSASRASLKDWELTLNVKRKKFSTSFYKPIFIFWLEIMILKNKIQAPGYFQARMKGNNFIVDAYRKVRFVGSPVPHIDPVKEVMAERLKLGSTGAHIPLTTPEMATENLGGGEFISNATQYALDLDKLKELKVMEAPVLPNAGDNVTAETKKWWDAFMKYVEEETKAPAEVE